MAQQVITTLVDDLDKESTADETVKFAIEGKSYEIDLTTENAASLREAFSPFVDAARKVNGRPTTTKKNTKSSKTQKPSGKSKK